MTAAQVAATMVRVFMGFSFYQPEDAPHWARKKYQEPDEIVYCGGMSKPLNLSLDRTAKAPLAEQIRKGVSTAIEDGVLEPGARLPSWQDLAAQLGVARGTVRTAYEKLAAAQLIIASRATGTR